MTKRVSRGIDSGAWYNKFFLRGAPQEIKNMDRIKIKGKPSNCEPEKDPDFYSMPPLPAPGRVAKSAPEGQLGINHTFPIATSPYYPEKLNYSTLKTSLCRACLFFVAVARRLWYPAGDTNTA